MYQLCLIVNYTAMLPLWLTLVAVLISTASAQTNVCMGAAGDYAILSMTGISNIGQSTIYGDIGVGPGASDTLTGFNLVGPDEFDPDFSTSTQVIGSVYAADYGAPVVNKVGAGISDMQMGYTYAAAQNTTDDEDGMLNMNINLGFIGGELFIPGVYSWDGDVVLNSNIYFNGSATDVFVLQTGGSVIVGRNVRVILIRDAKVENIIWQVAGFLEAGIDSRLEGIFLIKMYAAFRTGSFLFGRVFSQANVTLDNSTIVSHIPQGMPIAGPASPGDILGGMHW
jgi:hypothetical protein